MNGWTQRRYIALLFSLFLIGTVFLLCSNVSIVSFVANPDGESGLLQQRQHIPSPKQQYHQHQHDSSPTTNEDKKIYDSPDDAVKERQGKIQANTNTTKTNTTIPSTTSRPPTVSSHPNVDLRRNDNETTEPSAAIIISEKQKLSQQPSLQPIVQKKKKAATIVVKLSGEMANNLHHIAHGIGLQQWAYDEYGIECNIILRNDGSKKWRKARKAIQSCFPQLNNSKFDFELGNTKMFDYVSKLQKQWLGENYNNKLIGLINSRNITEIDIGMKLLQKIIMSINDDDDGDDDGDGDGDDDDPSNNNNQKYRLPTPPPQIISSLSSSTTTEFHIPLIVSHTLDVYPMIDRYYEKIVSIFEFDDTSTECCLERPNPTDIVFHFRNYISELPDWRAYDMGFLELSPNRTAHDMFVDQQRHDNHNHNVRITTRIPNQKARNYITALKGIRNINASLVEDQTGLQDFCFMMKTQYQLIGNARSTFVIWASLLGNSNNNFTSRLYHVDNIGLRQRHPDFWERFTYNFTNPILKQRIKFELYKSEEMDGFG